MIVRAVLLLCAYSASGALGSDIHPDLVLEAGYSIHEAPVVTAGQPLSVNFSINLRNVLGVNEKEQLISLETSLRMFWKDPRVTLKSSALDRPGSSDERDYITLNPRV